MCRAQVVCPVAPGQRRGPGFRRTGRRSTPRQAARSSTAKGLTVNVSAEATWPVLASVTAEVVQVSTDGSASGRISLGPGQDATLRAAVGVNYCTLGADKCKCPEGSGGEGTRFTPMEKGFQYVTVTGGLAQGGRDRRRRESRGVLQRVAAGRHLEVAVGQDHR